MVQPCDTTQIRSDSDFGVKSATIQVYNNSYNSQSNRWIELKLYVVSLNMLSYYGLRLQVNQCLVRAPQYWSKEAVRIPLNASIDFLNLSYEKKVKVE